MNTDPSRLLLLIAMSMAVTAAVLMNAAKASAAVETTTASVLLQGLPVAADEPIAGYSREQFKHWVDADHNGCNTRQEVLRAESQLRPRPSCRRTSLGLWTSPYDGRRFVRSAGMDIDHMVPLAEAWRSGARLWDAQTREAFANDLAYGPSLIAVTASVNRAKGDKDPAAWMPPRLAWRCTYLTQWVAIKTRWKLSVNTAEKQAISLRLRACPARAQTIVKPPLAAVTVIGDPACIGPDGAPCPDPTTGEPTTDPQPPAGSDDPRFGTCAEANAAGYGPYTRGVDPEYEWYTDHDGDGVVCE
jgi:hypothetical protein